ncbi:hypothetical protein BGX38DRAFT_1278253 [Terfezia claveryi]|nr:hypothetical protein BGX38DRAFT_1278253 [Terfezia claveryi]
MVTPKNLIQNSKTDLGGTLEMPTTYHGAMLSRTIVPNIQSEEFHEESTGRGSESHKKALEALLQDCLKKQHDEEDDISDAGEAAGTAVVYWVYDPEIGEHRDINRWIYDEWIGGD